MSGTVDTINRDAGQQAKGPRLQKLRAVHLLLKAADEDQHAHVYVSTEFQADVYVKRIQLGGVDEYLEEDKNYDPSVGFTIAHEAVCNTLVIFLDSWISRGCSPHVRFGFYAPNGISKERTSPRSTRLGIEWPSESCISSLVAKDFTDKDLLAAVRKIILDEYRQQYLRHAATPADGKGLSPPVPPDEELGNLAILLEWSDSMWEDFFRQIDWQLGQADEANIERDLLAEIPSHRFFNSDLAGKERYIVADLMDTLDRRQAAPVATERCLHASEVECAFLRLRTGTSRLSDPLWQQWQALPEPDDTRNVREKAEAIASGIDERSLKRWSRRAASALVLERSLPDPKAQLAYKYRVYEFCEEELSRCNLGGGEIGRAEIESCVDRLKNAAEAGLSHCHRAFHYPANCSVVLEEVIWHLFDSCYLSFEMAEP